MTFHSCYYLDSCSDRLEDTVATASCKFGTKYCNWAKREENCLRKFEKRQLDGFSTIHTLNSSITLLRYAQGHSPLYTFFSTHRQTRGHRSVDMWVCSNSKTFLKDPLHMHSWRKSLFDRNSGACWYKNIMTVEISTLAIFYEVYFRQWSAKTAGNLLHTIFLREIDHLIHEWKWQMLNFFIFPFRLRFYFRSPSINENLESVVCL